jgi:transcriptional regulator with XRE-family HTH domain
MSAAEGASLAKPGARVREVMAAKVAATSRSQREIERELGWGQGKLSSMLHGRTQISLRHIEALAPIVGSTPLELLEEIYEELPEDAPAEWRQLIHPLIQLGDKAKSLGRQRMEALLLMVVILLLAGYEEAAAYWLSPLVQGAVGVLRKTAGETGPTRETQASE